ncbi:MAG: glycosyltransferase family 4 protein [Candidatus Moranbacteria bacterium]|nr:glycosyltransferase family 4 protein [Candidatus Moranbacteria bacterium]
MNKKELKIALVHDFLTQFGGAERVLLALSEIFPDAPIYTLIYDKNALGERFGSKDVRVSFLQKFPAFLKKRKKWLLPFLPVAPETFDLRDFDLVISSSGAWSKGIVTRLNTTHVSYVHSPMRFIWDMNGEYLNQRSRLGCIRFITRFILNYIRVWDRVASDRPDLLLSNSIYTRDRIRKYYGRDSEVIYPPAFVPLSGTTVGKQGAGDIKDNYFLIVSRLSAYKKVDAAIEAFNKLELPLVVVGTGEQEKYLKSIAGKNIRFAGFVPDEKLGEIYSNARAFVFPGVDDFGIAPVEAMSYGVPVLSIRKGGMREVIVEGKTGEFFASSVPEVIADGVRRFIENEKGYDREAIRNKANEFSKEKFKKNILEYLEKIKAANQAQKSGI